MPAIRLSSAGLNTSCRCCHRALRPGKLSVIGNGVVIDPSHLIKEIALLRDQGADITPQTLVVSDTAALILPVHQAVDHAREAMRGAGKIGTTGRGIGPAYGTRWRAAPCV